MKLNQLQCNAEPKSSNANPSQGNAKATGAGKSHLEQWGDHGQGHCPVHGRGRTEEKAGEDFLFFGNWNLTLFIPSRPQGASKNQHLLKQIARQSKLRSMTTRMLTPMPTVLQSLLPTSLPLPLMLVLLPLLLRMLAQTPTNQLLRPRVRQGLWDQTQPSERDRTLIFCCKFNQPIWNRYIPLTDIICRSERAEAKGPDPSLCQGPMGLAKGPQARTGILAAWVNFERGRQTKNFTNKIWWDASAKDNFGLYYSSPKCFITLGWMYWT